VENYHQGWLHIDCSATYRKSAVEQWSAGATGLGVRTIANLLTADGLAGGATLTRPGKPYARVDEWPPGDF
jgi:hypothetical protein